MPRCGSSPTLNDPKRLKLTLSPPRARPAGAKSTDGHPPDFRKPDANSTISQSRYGRHQPPLNHDTTILRVESKNDSDSTIPHPIFSNHNSTTRKRIREAAAESSSSWSLGEYAVSIRSDFRSTASLPPHQSRQIRRGQTLLTHIHTHEGEVVLSVQGRTPIPAGKSRRRARLGKRTRARKLSPHVRARGLGTTGFARNPVLFFSLPLFS